MHGHGIPRSRQYELEADRFGSAFLMPAGDVLAHTPRTVSLAAIDKLKKRWSVSAIALVHRLQDLKLITEWQYRTFCIEISKRGGRRGAEGDNIQRETSQIFAKVFDALRAEGMTRNAIARELTLTVSELDSLLVGLVIASVPQIQSVKSNVSNTNPVTERPKLRVV